jgi:hypothetical protein
LSHNKFEHLDFIFSNHFFFLGFYVFQRLYFNFLFRFVMPSIFKTVGNKISTGYISFNPFQLLSDILFTNVIFSDKFIVINIFRNKQIKFVNVGLNLFVHHLLATSISLDHLYFVVIHELFPNKSFDIFHYL